MPIIPTFLYELHMTEESGKMAAAALQLNNGTLRTSTKSTLSPELQGPLELPCREALARLLDQFNSTPSLSSPLFSSLSVSPTSPPLESEAHLRHRLLVSENAEVGIMFASKPIVQALTNLVVGPLTNKIGYSWPLFAGLILLFLSTMGLFLKFNLSSNFYLFFHLVFAIGTTYPVLFLARSMQGVGSAFTSVAGMGMVMILNELPLFNYPNYFPKPK